jgi:hypothetical protein
MLFAAGPPEAELLFSAIATKKDSASIGIPGNVALPVDGSKTVRAPHIGPALALGRCYVISIFDLGYFIAGRHPVKKIGQRLRITDPERTGHEPAVFVT